MTATDDAELTALGHRPAVDAVVLGSALVLFTVEPHHWHLQFGAPLAGVLPEHLAEVRAPA